MVFLNRSNRVSLAVATDYLGAVLPPAAGLTTPPRSNRAARKNGKILRRIVITRIPTYNNTASWNRVDGDYYRNRRTSPSHLAALGAVYVHEIVIVAFGRRASGDGKVGFRRLAMTLSAAVYD